MSVQAFLSLAGLYNYRGDILDNFKLPDKMDRENFINTLLFECGEMELLYPNPDFLKIAVAQWSYSKLRNWQKLFDTEFLEYNPIENYDRIENWVDKADNTRTTDRTVNNRFTGSDSTDTTTNSDGNSTNKVRTPGFNTTVEPVTTETTDTDTLANTSGTSTTNSQNTTAGTENTTDTDKNRAEHFGRIHGNIGVTTSQQMIQAERKLWEFNTMYHIINEFKGRFLLQVY